MPNQKDSQKVVLTEEMFHRVGVDEHSSENVVRPNISYWQDAWRRLKQNKVAIVSMSFLIFVALMCIFAPHIYPHAFDEQIIEHTNQGPTASHIFGLDDLGRDIFARVWVGGRVSLAIGVIGAAISLAVGVLYGGMMRIVEILVGIPYMIVVILMSIILGKGMGSLLVALCFTSWTGLARLVRGQVINLMESEYILAAKALGTPTYKIIFRHLLPNTLSIIIVETTFSIPSFIFAESFLSFIGMGIQPPNTSWGAMAALGQQQMSNYPHELLFPALAISLTMLAFNLLGDGLRDAFDPKLRQ